MTQLRETQPAAFEQTNYRPVDAETLAGAVSIVEDIRTAGEKAVRQHAERLGDLQAGDPIVIERGVLDDAFASLEPEQRALLERTKKRIEGFALAQRETLQDLETPVTGGQAGHRWIPARCVGAYAPGGRYPLPSSVLMTVIPARVAGVETVWVASPRPSQVTLAAAALAGADGLLAIGGAQAIASFCFGTFTSRTDLVVGPGNRWVTAAKKHLFGEMGIDGLAGPSELLVIADDSAKPSLVAADLIAQAEHDVDAIPTLITTHADLVPAVNAELARQLTGLPTAETASAAIERNGRSVVVESLDEAARLSDRIAPEHLELCVRDPEELADKVRCYGGLFLGSLSAEVFGDYGFGPNHVLPTGGSARFQAGLSVATFLRASTWLDVADASAREDAAALARLEGLEGHARAALQR